MIAPVKPFRSRRSSRAWQAGFLAMMPAIIRHARVILPRLRPEARADALQEVIANAAVAYARLVELDKTDVAYPTPLAWFAVAQYKAGRRVGCKLNVRDVLSPYCQAKTKTTVERLDRRDQDTGEWIEAIVEDRRTPPADQAAFRVDFPTWLGLHTDRNRRIAEALAVGHTTGEVARRFDLSAGRVSQLRRQFQKSWAEYHGEQPARTTPAPVNGEAG